VLDRVCCGGPADDPAAAAAEEEAQYGKRRHEMGGGVGIMGMPSSSRSRRETTPPVLSREGSDGGRSCRSSGGGVGKLERDRLETVILPRLRFNPRISSSSSYSSLQDFFDMFLADDAPHSFRLFHESNGDEDVIATPWADVVAGDDGDDGGGHGEDRTERTVTFQTKISPGSSSNPLSQPERGGGGGGSASVIPLGVAIRQTLVRRPDAWILECEFAFDFHPSHGSATAAAAACPASSSSGGHATNGNNNGSVGGGAGKKFGTGLLGQYFMSNVVKGTTVNVAIILRECDDDAAAAGGDDDDGRRAPGGGVAAGPRNFLPDGILSCLVHPLLLLPPDGLCASRATVGRGGDAGATLPRDDGMRGGGGVAGAGCEPSRVGASLLSAIKARNAPCCDCGDLDGIAAPPDASLVGTPLVVVDDDDGGGDGDRSEAAAAATPRRRRSDSTGAERRPGGQSHHRGEDVLRCSSIGAMRSKRNASFDLSRTPSTIAMRRTILEKDTPSSAVGTNDSRGADYIPAQQRASLSSHHPALSYSSTPPRGLSMRIEMELGSSGNNNRSMSSNSSSLSSTFSRSTSMSTIDDKIRRGLRKRVARSWISWAESWCMRLWEDDDAERARRRRASSGTSRPDHRPGRRVRVNVNVRPTVRRIGDPAHARKERDGSSSVSSSSSSLSAKSASSSPATTTRDVWTKLHPGGDDAHRRVERWMSISEREGECGVEVACTMVTRRPSPAGVDLPPERRHRRPVGRRKRFWGNLSVTP